MTPDELRAHLSRLGLSQRGAAAWGELTIGPFPVI